MNENRGFAHGAPSCRLLARTCCLGALALGSPLTIACSGKAATLAALTWAGDTAWAELELAHDLYALSDSGGSLTSPFHVRHINGKTFFTDRGSDRVAMIDANGRVDRWIGNRGRGPGELFGVSHVAAFQDQLLVAEALNGRVSEFSLDGAYRRSWIAPFAAGALATTTDAIIIAARSAKHYAAALSTDAAPVPALRRPASNSSERWSILPGHDLIAGDSSRVWVFDQGSGKLCAFRESARGKCRSLPPSLLQRLRDYRDARVSLFERATRLQVHAAPLAKDFVRAGGTLAILLPLPEMPAVLIDPDDGAVTPVVHIRDTLPTWARAATSFAWNGKEFILVSDEGIGYMRITRER